MVFYKEISRIDLVFCRNSICVFSFLEVFNFNERIYYFNWYKNVLIFVIDNYDSF